MSTLTARAIRPSIRQPRTTFQSSFSHARSDTSRKPAQSQSLCLPPGAWDSHMHVVDPERFPLAEHASYKPQKHTLKDAIAFETSVGIHNIVLVQPSIYGDDNACLLDALQAIGPRRGRGVVVFDADTTSPKQLEEWHSMGVRGVRLNYVSHGTTITHEEIHSSLRRYADMIRPLNWVLQLYLPMSMMGALLAIAPELRIRLCIDHMGYPEMTSLQEADPYTIPGFHSLVKLLDLNNIYVKLSAPYRMSQEGCMSELDAVATELIRKRGHDRVVFATDWPHTRFEGLDIRPWMEKVLHWSADDAALCERLFVKNAEDLWDVSTQSHELD